MDLGRYSVPVPVAELLVGVLKFIALTVAATAAAMAVLAVFAYAFHGLDLLVRG